MVQRSAAGFLFAVFFGCTVLASAQSLAQDGIERTELHRVMLTGAEGTEVVVTRLVAHPGAVLPRHTHPGDEFAYVLEGGMIQPANQEPVTLETGSTMHFARDVPHGGFIVVGDSPITVITTHIVDAGVPMVVPVE